MEVGRENYVSFSFEWNVYNNILIDISTCIDLNNETYEQQASDKRAFP